MIPLRKPPGNGTGPDPSPDAPVRALNASGPFRRRPGNPIQWHSTGQVKGPTVAPGQAPRLPSPPLGPRQGARAGRRRAPDLNLQGGVAGFMVLLQASVEAGCSQLSVRRQRRRDWVRGDMRCLMCGRLLGRLLGTARSHENGDRSAGHPLAFVAYRGVDPLEPIVPFTPRLRFRCHRCGGAGALDDIDVFSTYDDVPDYLERSR